MNPADDIQLFIENNGKQKKIEEKESDDIQLFIENRGKLKDIKMMEQMFNDGKITDINVTTSIEGTRSVTDKMTALIYQSGNGRINAMKWILDKMKTEGKLEGINMQDSNGHTALFMAVFFGDPDKVQLLLDYGADRTIDYNYLLETANEKLKNSNDDAIKDKYSKIISLLETNVPSINNYKENKEDLLYEKNKKRSHLSWRNATRQRNTIPVFGSRVITAPTIQRSLKKGGKRRKTRKNIKKYKKSRNLYHNYR